jgi:hypothetical protein
MEGQVLGAGSSKEAWQRHVIYSLDEFFPRLLHNHK